MPNVDKARREIDHCEAVLRSRYHYDHPIFGYLKTARDALDEDAPAPPPEAEAEAEETDSVLPANEGLSVDDSEFPGRAGETESLAEPGVAEGGFLPPDGSETELPESSPVQQRTRRNRRRG